MVNEGVFCTVHDVVVCVLVCGKCRRFCVVRDIVVCVLVCGGWGRVVRDIVMCVLLCGR